MNSNEASEPSESTIQMVITQTNYSKEEAVSKLSNFNNDPIKVIRDFMGLDVDNKTTNNNNLETNSKTKTRSQERFRFIREEIYKDNYNKQLQNRS